MSKIYGPHVIMPIATVLFGESSVCLSDHADHRHQDCSRCAACVAQGRTTTCSQASYRASRTVSLSASEFLFSIYADTFLQTVWRSLPTRHCGSAHVRRLIRRATMS